jgi:hypothetical protein
MMTLHSLTFLNVLARTFSKKDEAPIEVLPTDACHQS